jgi:hypothetical protein
MNTIVHRALAATLFATTCYLPAHAAPNGTADTASAETINFEQYRDWRMHFIEERQIQVAAGLAVKDLTAQRRAALERQKAYYDFFAAMPAAERDRLFHERFDEMDANHDGIVDRDERTAWHEKQRAFYERSNSRPRQTAAGH